MNKAYLLSLNKEADITQQWDYGIVKDLLEGNLWRPPDWQDFNISKCTGLPKVDRAVVVLPARHHKGKEEAVNEQLKKINRVVLFLLGDEEADFDIDKISHENIVIWVQNPHMGVHDRYNKIGTGYPQHEASFIPAYKAKTLDVFFAGQITHQRREELADVLSEYKNFNTNITFIPTKGFTQGISKEEYYKYMSSSRIAPCPSGAIIPDSFRLFEALECMALVIADTKTPDGTILEYWDWLFGQITPFAQVNDWNRLYDLVPELLADYPNNTHKQTAWWIKWKRDFATKVLKELYV